MHALAEPPRIGTNVFSACGRPRSLPPEQFDIAVDTGRTGHATVSRDQGAAEMFRQGHVGVSCRVLGFGRQAYYAWLANPVCQRDYDDAHLLNTIIDIHADDPEFGCRFIAD